jgi:hypothetical protein
MDPQQESFGDDVATIFSTKTSTIEARTKIYLLISLRSYFHSFANTMKLAIFATLVAATAAFAPAATLNAASSTSLQMKAEDVVRKTGLSFAMAATILGNLAVLPEDAFAADFGGSSQVIAARSGGRAGGRSVRAPSRAAPPTVIERRTAVIQQPSYAGTAVMAPPMMAAPVMPMYSPAPSGLGLAIGLNAVSGIAEGFREARQENEIRSTREQLTEARIKEAEMEARLRQLEQAQMAR